jgi:hypothetical protein
MIEEIPSTNFASSKDRGFFFCLVLTFLTQQLNHVVDVPGTTQRLRRTLPRVNHEHFQQQTFLSWQLLACEANSAGGHGTMRRKASMPVAMAISG